MARIERSFQMAEPPGEAQDRFHAELGPSLHRFGFRLRLDEPEHLVFRPRYMGLKVWLLGPTVLGLFMVIWWGFRLMMGQRVEVEFSERATGSAIEIYGRASRGIADLIDMLGRKGHWPANREDPEWLPVPEELVNEQDSAWDDADLEGIDPSQLDRITRRALKKAGRL
jgi:hypothetical protein